MGFMDWLFGPTREGEKDVSAEIRDRSADFVEIAPGRGFTFDVVGEANYQDALDDICGGKCEEGHDIKCDAELYLDDLNEHDPNAVAVKIGGETVGYIPRDLAPEIRAQLRALNADGKRVRCSAKVTGGWYRSKRDQGHYGVKLSLSKPMRLQTKG